MISRLLRPLGTPGHGRDHCRTQNGQQTARPGSVLVRRLVAELLFLVWQVLLGIDAGYKSQQGAHIGIVRTDRLDHHVQADTMVCLWWCGQRHLEHACATAPYLQGIV